MAEREQGIVAEARITLNDVEKHRWTDERLFKLLDDAQQEVCRNVPLIAKKVTINTSIGTDEYRLPTDCLKVLTARSGGLSISTISMEELDHNNPGWEDTVGSQYTHLVVNNLSQQTIRPYPLMATGYTGMNLDIKIRYSAKPINLGFEIDDSMEELAISDTWDYGLTQYIISKAFIDYGDESSLSRAQIADSLYNGIIGKARQDSRKSFSKRVVTTGYQGRVARGEYYGSGNCRY